MDVVLIIVSVVILFFAGILFFKNFKLKNELEQEKLEILKELRQQEKKIEDLGRKEHDFLIHFEKIKQEKMEEINVLALKKNEEVQKSLNEMRLKQEKSIQIEIQEKRRESLKIFLEELEQKKKEIDQESSKEIEKIKEKLEDYRSIESAARMAKIRELNEKNEKEWHKITLLDEDLQELKELDQIKLRNPLPLRKAIYEIYYREPVRALLNRVLGENRTSGIYKITYLESGESYIGKSVDIHRRWQEHVKRGVGAEKETRSILYEAFKKYGIHNFTFEVIEELEESKLNERETYWIDYFNSNVFGFNMRR